MLLLFQSLLSQGISLLVAQKYARFLQAARPFQSLLSQGISLLEANGAGMQTQAAA